MRKREKNPFAKHQVLFVPRVASPCTHQQHQSKANKRFVFFGCLEKGCAAKNKTENQKIKKNSRSPSRSKKKTPISVSPKKNFLSGLSGKKNLSSLGEKGKRENKKKIPRSRNPVQKTPSLFYSSCCIAMHHQRPPLESQQKTCVFWTFGIEIWRRKRATTKKHWEKKPHRKTPSLFCSTMDGEG